MKLKHLLAGFVILSLVIFLASSYVVTKRLSSAENTLQAEITKATGSAIESAKSIEGGIVTANVAALIAECGVAEMVSYDSLLSSLDKGLPYTDLIKLNQLFGVCGDVAAKRRALMTILLNERVSKIEALGNLNLITKGENVDLKVAKWQELAKKETEISDLFMRLVEAQESIIVALINNVPATSITVENIRATAQKLREDMIKLTEEVVNLRSELGVS